MKKLLQIIFALLLIAFVRIVANAQVALSQLNVSVNANGTPVTSDVVLSLFSKEDTVYTFISSTSIDPTGETTTMGLQIGAGRSGNYIILAEIGSASSLKDSFISTYAGDKTQWKEASIFSYSGATQECTINLQPFPKVLTNWGGKSTLTGVVRLPTLSTARTLTDEVQAAVVTLYNTSGDRLTSTYTDPYGVYTFDNLAEGNYEIGVEYPGQETTKVPVTAKEAGTIITVDPILLSTEDAKNLATDILIFPNPASDRLYFSTPGVRASSSVRVLNSCGQPVMVGNIVNSQLSISELSTGVYILELSNDGKKLYKRFAKN